MLCRHFYNIKCLRNTYFICNIFLNIKQMLVFIFIKKNCFKFWPLKFESQFRPWFLLTKKKMKNQLLIITTATTTKKKNNNNNIGVITFPLLEV